MENIMERLEVDGAVIEYEVHGDGEPVLLIPVSVVGDGLGRPLLRQPELASRFRLIHYHRRGYLGSTLGPARLTISRQSGDAAALLTRLGARSAHIAGHSLGGLIALQLAVEAPELVHSLALLEPSLPMVPSAKANFGRLFPPVFEAYRSGNKTKALEIFSDRVFGPNWQSTVEQTVPGGVEQAVKDLDTFIQELGPMQEWQFGPLEAAAISKPVLSVKGVHSDQFQQEVRELLHAWLPQTEDCDIESTHLLQMQNPAAVAQGLAGFFSRHSIK